jgi:RNA polymerase sigma-70 factor (ECF subfamily)
MGNLAAVHAPEFASNEAVFPSKRKRILAKKPTKGELIPGSPIRRTSMPYSDSSTQSANHASEASARDSASATAQASTNHYSSNGSTGNEQAAILARAQAGDNQAFAQLYTMHKRRIYSLCLRMVGSVAEAEDLTQEAFLQFHRKIDTFRGESALSTWLHRLAINVVLMHLRKKGLQLTSLDEAMEPAPDQRPGRSFGAPDLILSGAIDRLALQRAIDDLPAGYRLIFVLHDIEGYEHNEIATLLDCSIGNSKSQLHKARLKLREALRTYPLPEARR